ncbi:hypothetical protein WH47_02307 [Habropoda laboriosa]|uniref:Uncharacterized protein n=1 Tax=Habropoda laboriosa TaxID=597456 RepID=A0A0L7QY60_9HYME|nr:hypothetical protein WH47_02307 [Habropoda laboriosa]
MQASRQMFPSVFNQDDRVQDTGNALPGVERSSFGVQVPDREEKEPNIAMLHFIAKATLLSSRTKKPSLDSSPRGPRVARPRTERSNRVWQAHRKAARASHRLLERGSVAELATSRSKLRAARPGITGTDARLSAAGQKAAQKRDTAEFSSRPIAARELRRSNHANLDGKKEPRLRSFEETSLDRFTGGSKCTNPKEQQRSVGVPSRDSDTGDPGFSDRSRGEAEQRGQDEWESAKPLNESKIYESTPASPVLFILAPIHIYLTPIVRLQTPPTRRYMNEKTSISQSSSTENICYKSVK